MPPKKQILMESETIEKPFVVCERRITLKHTCLYILEAILEFNYHNRKETPSLFDNKSNINTEQNKIDNYDFQDFFQFCFKKLKLDDNLLILIMMNIDKVISNESFALSYNNINRLFYTCLCITKKYYEDNSYNNRTYANLVGLSCDDLLDMEMEYMSLINFHLFIKDDDYVKYQRKMLNCMN